jgi:hypothetical protein
LFPFSEKVAECSTTFQKKRKEKEKIIKREQVPI